MGMYDLKNQQLKFRLARTTLSMLIPRSESGQLKLQHLELKFHVAIPKLLMLISRSKIRMPIDVSLHFLLQVRAIIKCSVSSRCIFSDSSCNCIIARISPIIMTKSFTNSTTVFYQVIAVLISIINLTKIIKIMCVQQL